MADTDLRLFVDDFFKGCFMDSSSFTCEMLDIVVTCMSANQFRDFPIENHDLITHIRKII